MESYYVGHPFGGRKARPSKNKKKNSNDNNRELKYKQNESRVLDRINVRAIQGGKKQRGVRTAGRELSRELFGRKKLWREKQSKRVKKRERDKPNWR